MHLPGYQALWSCTIHLTVDRLFAEGPLARFLVDNKLTTIDVSALSGLESLRNLFGASIDRSLGVAQSVARDLNGNFLASLPMGVFASLKRLTLL